MHAKEAELQKELKQIMTRKQVVERPCNQCAWLGDRFEDKDGLQKLQEFRANLSDVDPLTEFRIHGKTMSSTNNVGK